MRFLCPFGLVDGTSDLIVGPFKGGFVLRPHRQDDLNRLAQTTQALTCTRIGVAIATILVLVPTRSDTQFKTAMTEYIDSAGHLCKQRWIAIAVTGHDLTNAHTFRVASQGGDARPSFKGHLLDGWRDGMEVCVEHDG